MRRDLELQEALFKFGKFLQENDGKRARALKKAQEEKRLCDTKQQEIERLVPHSQP